MSTHKQFVKSKQAYKVTFSIPQDNFNKGDVVKVLGTFNDWQWEEGAILSPKDKKLKTDLLLQPNQAYQYRFMVNNKFWFNDGDADSYTDTPFGVQNSISLVPEAPVVNPVKKPSVKSVAVKTKKKAATKSVLKVKTSAPDKLTKIEGIGPKIEGLLRAQGIDTFANLGSTSTKKLKDILAGAGSRYQMHDPSTWPKQAKLAAEEKWDALKILQDKLKGGKDKKAISK